MNQAQNDGRPSFSPLDDEATENNEDTLLRAAGPAPDFIASVPSPAAAAEAAESAAPVFSSPEAPPWGTYLNSALADQAREHRPADDAPIQRFDQRPRFEFPEEPEPPASPVSGTPVDSATPAAHIGMTPGRFPPGVDATARHRRRLPVPAIALGCSFLLLLGIGTGVGVLWLNRPPAPAASGTSATAGDDATADDPSTDPAQWRPLDEGEQATGSTEELLHVLSDNPLTTATLPVPAGCSLPASEGKIPDDELQGYLQAGADCLATTWSEALLEQGVEFTPPEVVVHPADEPPADSACAPETFTGTAPRACIGDNTLYWPIEWDPGFSTTSDVESPQLYMWHLSYSYAVFPVTATSLHSYYGALLVGVESDPERSEEMRRRYALQQSCFGAAAAFQQPTGPRPTGRVEEFVTSLDAQAEPGGAAEPSQQSRAAWVDAGRSAHGDLASCNTWAAAAGQVA